MVGTEDLQRPSTDMSKIIVAVGIGLFSLLILNIFDLLSFWTLVAVLVGVVLVLKFGMPSVGTVVALVIVGILVIGVMQIGNVLQQIKTGGLVVSDASLEQQLGGWEAQEGSKVRGGMFYSSSTRIVSNTRI